MSYWQGYPVSYSGASEWLTYPCLVNRNFLDQRGLGLGDTMSIQVQVLFGKIPILLSSI